MPCTPTRPDGASKAIPSKEMDPLPLNFLPRFIENQFRTTIELPTKQRYPHVQGKCAIVTGSNTGLGYVASDQLLSLGLSHLVMGIRSPARGEAAAKKLRAAHPLAKIDVWHLDMEFHPSIRAFVKQCHDLPRIDIAILNAGISPLHYATSPETGHEKTIQVNHLGTALLALLLIPVLKLKSPRSPARLTVVNSGMAHLCKFPNRDQRPLLPSFDDAATFAAQERYGVSKLLNQLFLVRLSETVKREDVTINLVEPGFTKGTELARDVKGLLWVVVKLFTAITGRPVDRGAATYVHAVLGQGTETHGCFLMNCKISPLACWYYTGGKALSDVVWEETLQELGITDIDKTLSSL